MISMTWIYIMLLMLAGSFILQMVPLLIIFRLYLLSISLFLLSLLSLSGGIPMWKSGVISFSWQALRSLIF